MANLRKGLPAAIFIDMDGTAVDSEKHWIAAEIALAAKYGREFSPEMGLQFVGTSTVSTSQWFQNWLEIEVPVPQIEKFLIEYVAKATRDNTPDLRPGFTQLVQLCQDHEIPLALVTSSDRLVADAFISHLPSQTFCASVAGTEANRFKPEPEPYLLAAELVGVKPADSMAIEDSPSGLASAIAAGMKVVGIECMNPIPSSEKITKLSSLGDLTLSRMREIMLGTTNF